MRGLLLLVLSLLASSALSAKEPVLADQWGHWRGPLANGVAPNAEPPLTWSTSKNVQWKAPIPGRGSATPVVWGDQVFVATAVKLDRLAKPDELPKFTPKTEKRTEPTRNFYQFLVLAYERETGKLLWQHKAAERVPHEGHHATHSYAAGSPTTDGKRLYVSFGSFGTYAYDLQGKLLWQRDLGLLETRLGWGEAVTPVVHGNSLLLNFDQEVNAKLVCLNAETGEVRWSVTREEKSSWNTPVVVEHAGKTQVIVNGATRIRAHDLADGKVIWECAGMTTNPIPSPIVDKGLVYVMSGYRGAAAVAIPLDSTGDVSNSTKIAWRYNKGTPYVPSAVLYEGKLYFTQANDGLLTILDAKQGKPILERERLPGVRSFYASPVAAAGRIYFVDREGTTVVLKAGSTLEVLATNKLDEGIDASPVAVGKQLFLRGEKHLFALKEK